MSEMAMLQQLSLGPIMADIMLPPRKWRLFVFVVAVACLVPSLSAVMMESRVYHGKQIWCMHSGLYSSTGTVCGTYGCARMFTGTVKSATGRGETDKRLEVVPGGGVL